MIIAIVESTPVGVEFVGENQLLCCAIVRFACQGIFRSVWINKTLSQIRQKRLVLFALNTEGVVGTRTDDRLCYLVNKSTAESSVTVKYGH